jgi:hypothetical protein
MNLPGLPQMATERALSTRAPHKEGVMEEQLVHWLCIRESDGRELVVDTLHWVDARRAGAPRHLRGPSS